MTQTRAMWVYPQDLVDETPQAVVDRALDLGLNEISVAVLYHAARVVMPRNQHRRVWYPEDGAAYFQPDFERSYGPLRPPVSGLVSRRDLLRETVDAARAAGLRVAFWVVTLQNGVLGRAMPNCTLKTAFGDQLFDYLCPANDVVRKYVLALLGDLADRYAPDAFYLEALSYKGWDSPFHVEIASVPLAPATRLLLGHCFCPTCIRKAKRRGLEVYPLHKWMRDTLTRALAGELSPSEEEEILGSFPDQANGSAAEWIRLRQDIVTSLYREIAELLGEDGPTVRLELFAEPDQLWRHGLDPSALAPYVSSAYVNCYADTAADVVGRWRSYAAVTPPDWQRICGLRVGYGWLNSAAETEAALMDLTQAGADGCCFYNYSLMTEQHLDWIKQAIVSAVR